MLLAPLGETRLEPDDSGLDIFAAESGNLEALKWILRTRQSQHEQDVREAERSLIPEEDLPPESQLLEYVMFACEDDDVANAYADDYNKRRELTRTRRLFSAFMRDRAAALMLVAVEAGHLPVVQWLHGESRPALARSLRHAEAAVEHGRLEVLAWLVSAGYPLQARLFELAAEKGHLGVLRFLLDSSRPGGSSCSAHWGGPGVPGGPGRNSEFVSRRMHEAAARSGRVDVLEWLRRESDAGNIRPLADPSQVIENAASAGCAECVLWALDQPCAEPLFFEKSERACTRAAAGGHLDMIKWLKRELGFPLSAPDCLAAIDGVAKDGVDNGVDNGGPSPEHEAIVAWINGGAQ